MNDSTFDGQFIQLKQRPRTAYKQTQFKDRRLITLLDCKIIFNIIWEGIMLEYHYITLDDNQRRSYDRENVIHYTDLAAVVVYSAE